MVFASDVEVHGCILVKAVRCQPGMFTSGEMRVRYQPTTDASMQEGKCN